jgi:lipopolysaccharide export system ATP-binding protein
VVITDHNVRDTLAITDRSYILYEGRILAAGTSGEILKNHEARRIYLGDRFTI